MNQLFYKILNPKENFFLEGFVCWRHERAQWEYEARSRNWIWFDKIYKLCYDKNYHITQFSTVEIILDSFKF